MGATVHLEANEILPELVAGLRASLGSQLVGVYLYGSLLTGDFTPGVSDVDLLAATRETIDGDELDRLRAMHARLVSARSAWTDRVEVAYVPLAALRTFKTARSRIGIISPGEPLHVVDAGRDWLMNWYLVRTMGVTLVGPPPNEIITPVSTAEFVDAIREHTCTWGHWTDRLEDLKSQSYAILTMCRTLCTHRTGEHISKQQAAQWASQRLPEWAALIRQALAWREGVEDTDPAAALPRTTAFVELVRGEVCQEIRRPETSPVR